MENVSSKKQKWLTAKNVSYLAVLVALVVVLQLFASAIPIGATGVNLSFVLLPIVLGGMLLGPWAGGLLGLIFGIIVLASGISGANMFTNILFTQKPLLTSLICLVKGAACGLVSGLLFKLLSKKNKYVATYVAAAAAPIVNTGIFILGCLCMSGTMEQFLADGQTVIYFVVIVCAGVNFLIEFAINIILAPALYTVTNVVEKQIIKKTKKTDHYSENDNIE